MMPGGFDSFKPWLDSASARGRWPCRSPDHVPAPVPIAKHPWDNWLLLGLKPRANHHVRQTVVVKVANSTDNDILFVLKSIGRWASCRDILHGKEGYAPVLPELGAQHGPHEQPRGVRP